MSDPCPDCERARVRAAWHGGFRTGLPVGALACLMALTAALWVLEAWGTT